MDKAKYFAAQTGIATLLLIFIALYVPIMLLSILTFNNLIVKSVNLIRNLDNKAKARYIFAPILKEIIKTDKTKQLKPIKSISIQVDTFKLNNALKKLADKYNLPINPNHN